MVYCEVDSYTNGLVYAVWSSKQHWLPTVRWRIQNSCWDVRCWIFPTVWSLVMLTYVLLIFSWNLHCCVCRSVHFVAKARDLRTERLQDVQSRPVASHFTFTAHGPLLRRWHARWWRHWTMALKLTATCESHSQVWDDVYDSSLLQVYREKCMTIESFCR